MQPKYKSNRNVMYSCKYHVIWCPKYRRKVLVGAVEQILREIISEAVFEHGSELMALEILPDHVHLLVEVDPQFGIHWLVKYLKERTSRYLRNEFHKLKSSMPCLWTNSYFVSTVGGSPLSIIKQYVENQKKN